MKTLNLFVTTLVACMISVTAFSQTISGSAQFGYAGPQGDAFKDENGEKLASFGLGFDFDLMLFLDDVSEKLAVGVMYSGNVLIGKESDESMDIGLYRLSLYGVKAHYRLLDHEKSVSPYGNLSLGLTQFSGPDITTTDGTVYKSDRAYSAGIRPEIGLNIGGILLSVAYLVPMKYTIESSIDPDDYLGMGFFDGTAGTFNISLGYRGTVDLSSSSFF